MEFPEPRTERRREQSHAGIRLRVTMDDLEDVIPVLVDEVAAWLAVRGIGPAGVPLVRYHVIDMARELDITVGLPVSAATRSDGRVLVDTLPAGRYAALVFTGAGNGIRGNATLIGWIADRGLRMDVHDDGRGEAFGGRVEHLLDGPEDDPDPTTRRTEVAIRLADR